MSLIEVTVIAALGILAGLIINDEVKNEGKKKKKVKSKVKATSTKGKKNV